VLFAPIERQGDSAAICARSAEILATQVDGAVCVVDADLREPSLHRRFGVEVVGGLTDVLRDGDPTRCFAQLGHNLWLLPSGARVAEPHTLLTSDRLRGFFKNLREQFEYVLISAPPFGSFAESIHLSELTDGVVLVVEAHATRRERARKIKTSLDAGQVPLLGVVLNNRTFPIPEWVYRRL
jgi:Mrp family chromosome partitioning ATPase